MGKPASSGPTEEQGEGAAEYRPPSRGVAGKAPAAAAPGGSWAHADVLGYEALFVYDASTTSCDKNFRFVC